MKWLVALLVVPLLAGCVADDGPIEPSAAPVRTQHIEAQRGAIDGILLDDRFRPVPGGLVLLHEWALTTTTRGDGSFFFKDLPPGEYTLRVDADGHEAVPAKVQVEADAWTEAAIVARRTAGSLEYDDRVVMEFALRVACQIDAVVLRIGGCLIEGNEGPRRWVDLDHRDLPATRMTTEAWVNRAAETTLSYEICDTQLFICYIDTYDRHSTTDGVHRLEVALGETGEGGSVPWHNDQEFDLEFRVDDPSPHIPLRAGIALEVVAQVVHTVHIDYVEPDARSSSQTTKSRT